MSSEEVHVLEFVEFLLWFAEIWLDLLGELLVVLAVNHEVEHWLDVSVADSDEIEVNSVPDLEHDWRLLWINPLLVTLGHVNDLEHFDEELSLVLHDSLVLLTSGDLLPVTLHRLHLTGLGDGGDHGSELGDLWDLVHGVVLHLSELVVLGVEVIPLVVVNINSHVVVTLGTPDLGTFLSVHFHLHVSHLDLLHLGLVELGELLHLWGWLHLLHHLDVLGEGDELFGVHEGDHVVLEDFSDFASLKLVLVNLGLVLESLGVLLETLEFLFVDGVFPHINGVIDLIHWRSGNSGGDGSKFEHSSDF